MERKNNFKNIKIYPIYKLFAYDLLFFYAIQMLFLHNVKGISLANIVLLSSLYSAFQMAFQLPSTFVVDVIGYKKCMIIGNILCTTSIITYIFSNSFSTIMLGDLQMALGYALKSVSESSFIYSIMKKEHMQDYCAKIEAKGSSMYFFTEAIASILSGLLYTINPYIPMILCTLSLAISVILSMQFNDSCIKIESISKNDYILDFKESFKFILQSQRLKALLVFACAFAGIVAVANSFSKTFLTDIGVSSISFGVITCALNILSAMGSTYQEKFHNRKKKKTLSYISVLFTSVFMLVGLMYFIGFNNSILINVGFLVFALQNFFKGGYRVLIKRYLNNFTTTSIRPKILSIYYLSEMFGTFILLFLASKMLEITDIGISYIIFGTIFLVLLLLVLDYMKTRVGLKPEQYNDKDINYKNKKA